MKLNHSPDQSTSQEQQRSSIITRAMSGFRGMFASSTAQGPTPERHFGFEALEEREVMSATPLTELHVDMQQKGGLLQPGYVEMSPLNRYTPTNGVGLTKGGLLGVDFKTGTALSRDAILSVNELGVAADVANGWYNVTYTQQNPHWAQDKQQIFLEGQLKGSISAQVGQLIQQTYRVQVTDGQLNITVKDQGGLNTLILTSGIDIKKLTQTELEQADTLLMSLVNASIASRLHKNPVPVFQPIPETQDPAVAIRDILFATDPIIKSIDALTLGRTQLLPVRNMLLADKSKLTFDAQIMKLDDRITALTAVKAQWDAEGVKWGEILKESAAVTALQAQITTYLAAHTIPELPALPHTLDELNKTTAILVPLIASLQTEMNALGVTLQACKATQTAFKRQESKDAVRPNIALLEERMEDLWVVKEEAVGMKTAADTELAWMEAEQKRMENPYARMYAEAFENTGSGSLLITFANPGDQTYIEYTRSSPAETGVRGSQLLSHPGGTKNQSVSFGMQWHENDLSYDGSWRVLIWDGPEKTKLLDSVEGGARPSRKQLWVQSEQRALDDFESGRTVEKPIAPGISVIMIDGPNVLVHITSPHDQSIIGLEGGGMFGSQTIAHKGGTAMHIGELTMNGDTKSGIKYLRFYDRNGGRELDRIALSWDQGAKKLSLVDAADAWKPSVAPTENGSTATIDRSQPLSAVLMEELERQVIDEVMHMQPVLDFQLEITIGTVTISDRYLDLAMKETLYQKSRYFYDHAKLEQKFYEKNPHYAPANFEAYVLSQMQTRYVGYSYGQAYDMLNGTRMAELSSAQANLFQYYAPTMGDLMGIITGGITNIKNGGSEQAMRNTLSGATTTASISPKLIELAMQTGIGIPSANDLLEEGIRIWQEHVDFLFHTEQEMLDLQEWKDKLALEPALQLKNGVTPVGEKPVSDERDLSDGYQAGEIDAEEERRLARNVRLANTALAYRNDPRAVLVVQAQELRIARATAGPGTIVVSEEQVRSLGNAVGGSIVRNSTLLAFAGLEIEGLMEEFSHSAAEGDALLRSLETSWSTFESVMKEEVVKRAGTEAQAGMILECVQEEPVLLMATGLRQGDANDESMLRTVIRSLLDNTFSIPTAAAASPETIERSNKTGEDALIESLSWFDGTLNIPGLNVYIRNDTVAGKMLCGLIEKIAVTNDLLEQISFARNVEQVTDIPWWKIMQAVKDGNGHPATIGGNLMGLFEIAGYGHLFNTVPNGETPSIITAVTDKLSYDSGTMRIRFDVALGSTKLSHAAAYVMLDSMQLSLTEAVGSSTRKLFVDIPISSVAQQVPISGIVSVQFKVAVWFGTETNNMSTLVPKGLTTESVDVNLSKLAFDPADILGSAYGSLSEVDKTLVKNALDFGAAIPQKNAELITWLVNNFLKSTSTEGHKMTFNATTNQWVGTAYVPTEENGLLGECKYWIQQNVLLNGLNISTNNLLYHQKRDDQGNLVFELNNDTGKMEPVYENTAFQWNASDTIEMIVQSTTGNLLDEAIIGTIGQQTVMPGDMIQYTGGTNGQHTVIIGKITDSGIWVFDSNYVSKTPSYHFFSWESLNNADRFTIYRLR